MVPGRDPGPQVLDFVLCTVGRKGGTGEPYFERYVVVDQSAAHARFPRSATKPPLSCAVPGGARTALPAPAARPHATWEGFVRVWRCAAPRVFSNRLHHIPA